MRIRIGPIKENISTNRLQIELHISLYTYSIQQTRLSSNAEANVLESLENLKEMFPRH